MEYLIEKFRKKLLHLPVHFQRSLIDDIHWEARLIGIKGARGAGKTTLMLQHIKSQFPDLQQVLYVSLDDLWFADNSLSALADQFVKQGGHHLFLDEVHKYPSWSRSIKNLYDDYPELSIAFTGSSLLEILNARADLSRRAIVYELQGLSFREYLQFTGVLSSPPYSLAELLSGHEDVASEILREVKPLAHFNQYLEMGFYPYFKEVPELYANRLSEVINLILEIELPLLRNVDVGKIPKLKQLLMIVAESAPFKPNISSLSAKIGINRETLLSYLHHLSDTGLILSLYKASKGVSRLQKPDKIYLGNTNLAYVLRPNKLEIGTLRETFFANQTAYRHQIAYPDKADFLVDEKYLFEVGGRNKSTQQLKGDPGYLAIDNIELGNQNRIPLWLFGFLY